jgi:hypothetical protein
MPISPQAAKPAPQEILVDVARLERECYAGKPDPEEPAQRVAFGTGGRGASAWGSGWAIYRAGSEKSAPRSRSGLVEAV